MKLIEVKISPPSFIDLPPLSLRHLHKHLVFSGHQSRRLRLAQLPRDRIPPQDLPPQPRLHRVRRRSILNVAAKLWSFCRRRVIDCIDRNLHVCGFSAQINLYLPHLFPLLPLASLLINLLEQFLISLSNPADFLQWLPRSWRNRRAANPDSRVTVIGSGNWGSVAAKLIASNAIKNPSFHGEAKEERVEHQVPGNCSRHWN